MTSRPIGRAGERGSVLVEAMVAITIIAMVLGVCLSAMGSSALRSRAAETSRTAVLIARSRLAAVGAETPLTPGETTGEEDGFAWRVEIAPSGEGDEAPGGGGRLLRVSVTVRDLARGAERARLETLRLEPAA